MSRPFKLINDKRSWLGGVCGGVAYWLAAPIWIVRLLWAVAFFGYGIGFGAYVLLWIFVPRWQSTPADYVERTGDS